MIILYSERALRDGTDDATVICAGADAQDILSCAEAYGCVVAYEYDEQFSDEGDTLVNERFVGVYRAKGGAR